jgi:hypothetical protein
VLNAASAVLVNEPTSPRTAQEDVAATFKAAASAALDDMEQSFAPYTDAVAVEADKWDGVRRRVAELDADLQSIRSRLDSL